MQFFFCIILTKLEENWTQKDIFCFFHIFQLNEGCRLSFTSRIQASYFTYLSYLKFPISYSIIHPCDPTVVICYLIWLCDTAVRITYLISHNSSLSYTTVIKTYFRLGVYKAKLPLCLDIIRCTSLGFPSWCPESNRPMDSCFQGTHRF